MGRPQKILLSLFFAAFLFLGSIPATISSNTSSFSEERGNDNEHILFGYPGTDGTILNRKGYVLSHNNEKKVADWVSYHLKDTYLVKKVRRTNNYRADPDLSKGQRSELEDYRGSGYDRGHLAPAGDMTRNKVVMSESFLLSNMAPQVGVGFNRGIWEELESKVREWARERKNLYIITGPIYSNSDYETIGPNRVAVPTHFYKIVVSRTESGEDLNAIAFILPNKRISSSLPGKFITTIDEVERLTGLDFLHELEDGIEEGLESSKSEMW